MQVFDGQSALLGVAQEHPDLVILDWMLPRLDGLEVCRRIRRTSIVPVLMLTARAEEIDRVLGLEVGADDYLTKPFSIRELLARVRALTRRPWGEERDGAILRAGDVTLDPVRHVVRHEGAAVDLTAKEFALLATLLQRPGQVFTRAVLLDTVWGASPEVYANVVDLYVSYLRKKLDRGDGASHIRTVRGVGYTFEPQPGPR
jgi:DNA-binding response OmpR family regulator